MRVIMRAARKEKAPTWNNAAGPAAVTLLSLRRLGWSLCDESSFLDDKGTVLTFDDYGPRAIRALVERAAQDWTWRNASAHRAAYQGVDCTPLLAPIKRAFAAPCSPRWSAAAKGWLRSLCADAWDDSVEVCAICQSAMSPWHACWDCPAVKRFQVENGLSDGLAACARRGAADPLFSRRHAATPVGARGRRGSRREPFGALLGVRLIKNNSLDPASSLAIWCTKRRGNRGAARGLRRCSPFVHLLFNFGKWG